jgi:hypothetical protein
MRKTWNSNYVSFLDDSGAVMGCYAKKYILGIKTMLENKTAFWHDM